VIRSPSAPWTVNGTGLLEAPATVTITLPELAPLGTVPTMAVVLQFVGDAATPLNVRVLDPCVAPKFTPAIATIVVPAVPEEGDTLVILGVRTGGMTSVGISFKYPSRTKSDSSLGPCSFSSV
jgi:hypothetical protein